MSTSLARLAETAREQERVIHRQDRQLDKIKMENRVSTERMVGGTLSFVSAALFGALDGAFDLSDKDRREGDGLAIMGIPVTPIVGGLLGVLGIFNAVPGGYYVGQFGLGAANGWTYHQARMRAADTDFARERRDKYPPEED